MAIWQAAALALVAGSFLGLLVRRWFALGVPIVLYAVPVALVLTDRNSFSEDDSTVLILIGYLLFAVVPMMLGTALGIVLGRRVKPPHPQTS